MIWSAISLVLSTNSTRKNNSTPNQSSILCVLTTNVRSDQPIKFRPARIATHLYIEIPPDMEMKELNFKEISNARISSRIKQVMVLIALIFISIILSIILEA
jgi:hypothetical protein